MKAAEFHSKYADKIRSIRELYDEGSPELVAFNAMITAIDADGVVDEKEALEALREIDRLSQGG